MAYISVYIKLTIAGISIGPFDLYSDVDNFADAFDEGITREDLIAGYTSNLVPEGTTQIKIQSLGVCTNYIIINVAPPAPPTTTTTTSSTSSTTTTTTTIAPNYLEYNILEPDCETDCPRTNGEILINGVQAYSWTGFTTLPVTGLLYPEIGDTITINATCYAGGTCSVGMLATISITVNDVLCEGVTEGADAQCAFTFSENTTVDILPGCLNP